MFNKVSLLILMFMCFVAGNVWSLRVSFPPTLSNPLTDGQIGLLNKYLKEIWDMQNGRTDLDIVTSTKTNASNGEIWILNTAGVYSLQVKAGDAVRSVTLSP